MTYGSAITYDLQRDEYLVSCRKKMITNGELRERLSKYKAAKE